MTTMGENWIFDMSVESVIFDDELDDGQRERKESLFPLQSSAGSSRDHLVRSKGLERSMSSKE